MDLVEAALVNNRPSIFKLYISNQKWVNYGGKNDRGMVNNPYYHSMRCSAFINDLVNNLTTPQDVIVSQPTCT